jgi:drug/metabolite transporter (DMT)-like permease
VAHKWNAYRPSRQLKPHQALLVIALAMPVLSLLLFELFIWLSFMIPIEHDPSYEIQLVFLLLSVSLTPIGIVNYFTKYGVTEKRHQIELSVLAAVFYVGYFGLSTSAGFRGLPLPLTLLIFLLPPFLTLLSGWGIAHHEKRSFRAANHLKVKHQDEPPH